MADSFFVKAGKKRPAKRTKRAEKKPQEDEEITSDSSVSGVDNSASESESDHETLTDKRRRLAKEYLENLETELVGGDAFDAADLDREIISRRLKQDVAETSGQLFRNLENSDVGSVRRKRSCTRNYTAVAAGAWPYAFCVSKDRKLEKWLLDGEVPSIHSVCMQAPKIHKKAIVCVCANSKFVVTGSLDGKVVVWNAVTLELVKLFEIKGRQGQVLSVALGRKANELYVGSQDLRIRSYDLAQLAPVETLYGHQDGILSIAALGGERCISVGGRDRTLIFWKIPEESRLTFRSGEAKGVDPKSKDVYLENSVECCSMLDEHLFVSGSDNGNLTLWSVQRKKPVFVFAAAHDFDPELAASRASAETDESLVEIPPAAPRGITAIAAVPYSNTFFTGSWCGNVKMWSLAEDQRSFVLVRDVSIGRGLVSGLSVCERDARTNKFAVVALLSREPRLGRWHTYPGHAAVAAFEVSGV